MKFAIISDVHGNLPALEATMESIKNEAVDQILCLGDVVGYGARPNECLLLLREMQIPMVIGNHDSTAIGKTDIATMNSHARAAMEWTRENLSHENKVFLDNLPSTLEIENFLIVHASPYSPLSWYYIFGGQEVERAFGAFKQPVCFFGHTHFPTSFTNAKDGRRLINVGSVGQPRDRDPRACHGIFENATGSFRWNRVSYEIEKAAQQIKESGLPEFLAQRLSNGI